MDIVVLADYSKDDIAFLKVKIALADKLDFFSPRFLGERSSRPFDTLAVGCELAFVGSRSPNIVIVHNSHRVPMMWRREAIMSESRLSTHNSPTAASFLVFLQALLFRLSSTQGPNFGT